MANYGQHADYPPGHSRGGPCGRNCPYYDRRIERLDEIDKQPPLPTSEYKPKHGKRD